MSVSQKDKLDRYIKRVRMASAQIYRTVVLRAIEERIRETLSILYRMTPPPRSVKSAARARRLGLDYYPGKYSKGVYRKSFRFSIIEANADFNTENPESNPLKSSHSFKLNSSMFSKKSKVVFTNIAKKAKYNFYYSGLVDLYGWEGREPKPPWQVFVEAESDILSVWDEPIKIGVRVKK